jgi:hypothetical protein
MADKTVTAGSVLASSNAKKRTVIAGTTITAGQAVYEDPADSFKAKLADANNTAVTAKVAGIALQSVSSGQPLEICYEDDDFTPGFSTSLSAAADDGVYVLSGTAGGIAPIGDLAAAMYPVVLMVAKSGGTKAILKIINGPAVLTA